MAGKSEILIFVKNTSTNGHALKYSITGYAVVGGIGDPIVVDQELAASADPDGVVLVDPYVEIRVSVIDSNPTDHADYAIDYSVR